ASTGTGDGTLGLNLVDDDSISYAASNKLGNTGTGNGNFTGQVFTIDKTAPTVVSITRSDPNPSTLNTVHWTVTFSENVRGVNASHCVERCTGTVTSVGDCVSYASASRRDTDPASTVAGDGTLGLNLVDDDTILDTAGNPLGGTGAGNGNFTGQVYTIDNT